MEQSAKQEYLDYLYSHIEYEHIEMDCKDKYGVDDIIDLNVNELRELAYLYDYFD